MFYQQLAVPAPPLHDTIPSIPPAVEQVVLRALAKNPQQRFASVEAFATALEQAAQLRYGGTTLCTYSGHDTLVTSLAWSPDGGRIASIDLFTRQLSTQHFRNGTGKVHAVVWSPNGRYVAAVMLDQAVEVWHATTRSVVCAYRGHAEQVKRLAWSPDSQFLASSSADGMMQVWDAATGRHHFTYCDPSQSLGVIVWSPDGQRIASANRDQDIHIWQAA
jgi:eukaryotic-like serine/threonine-protein kinase